MSDTDLMYRMLRQAGPRGCHTLDLRREGVSGNPSQRAADIEAKYGVTVDREWENRGRRRGKRFRLSSGVESDTGQRKARKSQGTLDSGVAASSPPPASEAPPELIHTPSAYDPYGEWA